MVTEGGALEIVRSEAVRHVDFESLLEVLKLTNHYHVDVS